eukprot:scaffold664330_cov57-Prasinocladus_malaysianus.AAC.1
MYTPSASSSQQRLNQITLAPLPTRSQRNAVYSPKPRYEYSYSNMISTLFTAIPRTTSKPRSSAAPHRYSYRSDCQYSYEYSYLTASQDAAGYAR